jgi:hypothetical protein
MGTSTKKIAVGNRYYDWQITSNVVVVDVEGDYNIKCKVEPTGEIYFARINALESPRD